MAMEQGGVDNLKRASDNLQKASHKLAEAMYSQQGANAGAAGAGPQQEPPKSGGADDVIDAEVVDEKK